MSEYEKTYISKKTPISTSPGYPSLKKLRGNPKNHLVGYEGKEYLAFEVVSLKEPGQYGKNHTACISKKVAESKGKKSGKTKV